MAENLQTAAAVRAGFLQMIRGLDAPDLSGVMALTTENEVDPSDFDDGIFITLTEGQDVTLDVIIGGPQPRYEVMSIVSFDVVTVHSKKDKEAVIRRTVMQAIEADPFLGGLTDDIRIRTAENDVEPESGAEKVRSTAIPIELHYLSDSPVG